MKWRDGSEVLRVLLSIESLHGQPEDSSFAFLKQLLPSVYKPKACNKGQSDDGDGSKRLADCAFAFLQVKV